MRSRALLAFAAVLFLPGLAFAQAYPLKKGANGWHLVD